MPVHFTPGIRRGILALAAISLLAGCATEDKYRQSLSTLIGTPEDQLVMHWGAPAASYETGGSKYLTYRQSVTYYQPDEPAYTVGNFGEVVPTGLTSGYVVHRGCDTTFQVTNNKIVAFNFTGNSCVSQ
jgi:hypothetical protein